MINRQIITEAIVVERYQRNRFNILICKSNRVSWVKTNDILKDLATTVLR